MSHFAFRRRLTIPSFFDWILVAACAALLTVAILPNLLNSSAYFDEGYSAYLASQSIFTMANYTALDVHPPLYYAALHVWHFIVGDDVAALRFLSVMFGWVALVFGFLIVRRWFGRQAAWLAALLMALSPLFVRYGGTMRMYTMALAIALAATYVLLRAVTSKKKQWWVAYALLVAAGMWTNYFMALVWVTHLLWLLYEYRRNQVLMRHWAIAIGGAVVLYLPWLPWLVFRYGEIQVNGFWIKPLSIETLASTVTQSFVFRSAADTQAWLAIGVIVLIVSLGMYGRDAYRALRSEQKSPFRMLLAMTSLPVILLAIASLPPLRPSYTYRYVLVAAVTSSLLMAVILIYARKTHRTTRQSMGVLVLTLVILTSGVLQVITLGNRNLDTNVQNKLAQVIQAAHHANTPATIVVRSPYSYYAARLYTTPDYPIRLLFTKTLADVGSTKPLYDHPEDSVKNFDTLNAVWLVGEDFHSVSTPAKGEWQEKKRYTQYDDSTKKPIAYAVYYERINK